MEIQYVQNAHRVNSMILLVMISVEYVIQAHIRIQVHSLVRVALVGNIKGRRNHHRA